MACTILFLGMPTVPDCSLSAYLQLPRAMSASISISILCWCFGVVWPLSLIAVIAQNFGAFGRGAPPTDRLKQNAPESGLDGGLGLVKVRV